MVTGTTTFNNDVTINANLTVTGTRTYVNTQTLDISDNIITLNADLPAITAPTENAGIEINRGSSSNVQLRWNETSDWWEQSNAGISVYYKILSNGDIIDSVSSTSIAGVASANSVKTAYDNAITAYTNATSFSANATNISSGTLNTARLPAQINVSANINVGAFGTTNGTSITNTAIVVGNSSANATQQWNAFIVSNASSQSTLAPTYLLSLTVNASANLNVGAFGTTNGVNIQNTVIVVGNTTSNTIVSGNLISVSNTANLTSTTLTIGTTTVNASLINAAAINVVNQTNTATLYVTTSANIGGTLNVSSNLNIGAFGIATNGVNIQNTVIIVGNTTSNAIVSGNLISVSNTANLTSTTLTIGTTTVNTSLINAAAINVVNQTNTATLYVTTSANVGTAFTVNSSVINAAANLSMAAYSEKMTSLAITTNGTTDLNLQTSSVFKVTVANTVVTSANVRFINPPASGTAVSATLILQYLGTGANSIATLAIQGNTSGGAAGTMKYAYNTQPTLTLTPAKSDILSVITYDGGSSYIVAPSFMNFTT